jgi:hypothetical protein
MGRGTLGCHYDGNGIEKGTEINRFWNCHYYCNINMLKTYQENIHVGNRVKLLSQVMQNNVML